MTWSRRSRPLEERFWEKVDKTDENGCWLWTASTNGTYGVIGRPGGRDGMGYAHRVVLELDGPPLAPALEVHHVCENKLCVNPEHLEVLDKREHEERHFTGCHKHGFEDMRRVRSGRYEGDRYCNVCARDRARRRRAERRAAA